MPEKDDSNHVLPLRLFLCHSSGDKQAIRELYRRLEADGFQPWLDEVDIRPGENWDFAIRRAVRASDIVAVCVSSSSVAKSGYLQKEIKFALDVADEKPDGAVFIIPVRLEPCEIPERLNRWQYVDLFESNGYERLVAALRNQIFSRLLDGFIRVRGVERNHIGVELIEQAFLEDSPITQINSDSVVSEAVLGLSSERQIERIRAALRLVNRCFLTKGKLAFLDRRQQQRLTSALSMALDKDEATQCAAMWALVWLTGARERSLRSSVILSEYLLLDHTLIAKVFNLLKLPGIDSNTLKLGCLLLTRESGLNPIPHQIDWIYELACIADGAKPRRSLPRPSPTGQTLPLSWMRGLLLRDVDLDVQFKVAQTMGAFGVFASELREPLRLLFLNSASPMDERDEALVYLSLSGIPGVAEILIHAADMPPVGKDDYLYGRGLFGLLLLDEVDILAQQIRKDLPHADPTPYAFGLAGSQDPRGRSHLETLLKSGTPRIRNAAQKALKTSWK